MGFPVLYDSMRERVFSRCREGENGCWDGMDDECRGGYHRQNYYIPGLKDRVKLTTHLLAYVLHHCPELLAVDDVYLAYIELRSSGLELDHTCDNPSCRNPGHLEPKTHSQNMIDGYERRKAAKEARDGVPIVNYEPEPHEIEF